MAASRDVERKRALELERQREREKRKLNSQQWQRDFTTLASGNAGFLASVEELINHQRKRNSQIPDADGKSTASKVLLFF